MLFRLKWRFKYFKKRFLLYALYFLSFLKERRFWEINIDGLRCKLFFSHPYQHLFARNLYYGKHERVLLSLWKKQAEEVNTGGVIFDVGAYNGIYGLIAALSNPEAQVVIIEPDEINAKHILHNIQLNLLKNVTLLRAVMTDVSGEIPFTRQPGATAGYVQESPTASKVKSFTLDEWSKENQKTPDLMKFDISGGEQDILLGSAETLTRAPRLKILLEFYPNYKNGSKVSSFWLHLTKLGYKSLYLYPRSDGKSIFYFVFKNL